MSITESQGLALALRRARRAQGRTGDNPAVGCLLLSPNGHMVALAHTGDGGRPHGEVAALAQAGEAARGGTAFVTLEPCAHHGRSGPCCDALIAAGLARVVVGCGDENPLVAGQGIARMRAAGIEVVEAEDAACQAYHAGFNRRMGGGPGKVILKIATSADGGMTKVGATTQVKITGEEVRRQVHLLRAQADVLITGAGTMAVDQPQLNVRMPGYNGPQPQVIVWQRNQRLADVQANTILIEAGPRLAGGLFGQIDELHWYRSPARFGASAVRPAFLRADPLAFASDHPSFTLVSRRSYGADIQEIWQKG